MTEADKDMMALDALFAEARDVMPRPGDDLMARILADAATAMRPVAAPVAAPVWAPGPTRSGWRSTLAAIGGWPALGGMALATMAGVWIGVAPPDRLNTLASGVWGETVSVQLYPDDDPFGMLEG